MISDFIKGAGAYVKAFQTISEMRLWKYLLVPGLISLLLGGSIVGAAWGMSDNLGMWLQSWYPWELGAGTIAAVAGWIGMALILIFGLIIYKHLILVVVSPFMSPLSQKVEERITGIPTPNKGFQAAKAMKDIVRGLRIALRNITKELFFVSILFLLGLIPVIGWVCSILIFLVQAYYAGFGNLDYTLERHCTVKGSNRFVKDNRWLAVGNGTVFLLILMTGIGFLFAPPLATVAATLEATKRLDSPQIQSREGQVDYV